MKIPKALKATKTLKPVPYVEEMAKLRQLFLRAEQDLINIIGYKKERGQVIYSHGAQLERVQKTLQNLIDDSWEYVPNLIEDQYLMGKRHLVGYKNATALTTIERNVVDKLVHNLMAEITEASITANKGIQKAWQDSLILGRREPDVFRSSILEEVAAGEASGLGIGAAQKQFLKTMEEKGIVAFTDKAGRDWSLRSYADMATRTTSRQATNLGVLFADESHDLYQISSHGTTCPICAPLEGRVYSRSGKDPNYPPLARAFGKVDPNGSDDLDNTWLNIHPNCLHVMIRFYEAGRSEDELRRIREFSSFETNPETVDPRSKVQIKAYRDKEQGRSKLLNDFEQFKRYKTVLGDKMPKTFQTFLKHKVAGGDKYKQWQQEYRKMNKALKAQK